MDSELVIIVLRLLHIVAGVFWVGAAITTTFFTMPTARAAGPIGGQFMGQFMSRTHYSRYMLAAGLITVATGGLLYWDFYADIAWSLSDPGPETIFAIGGLLSVIVALVANIAFPRIGKRLGGIAMAIQAQGSATPAQVVERDRLTRTNAQLSMALTLMLITTTAFMAVGRFA